MRQVMSGVMSAALTFGIGLILSASALAQMVEIPDDPPPSDKTTRELNKAEDYMRARRPTKHASSLNTAEGDDGSGGGGKTGGTARYLDVHIGGYLDSQGYRWGHGDQYKAGKFDLGVDYRLGQWVNAADFMLRIDYNNYSLDEGTARQLSFSGLVSFPDANSRFPLYLGAAVGPGFFLKQIPHQSVLALDYSLFAGVRFLNVFQKLGFLAEIGIKDHIHIFSAGQFNGVYFNIGTVWLF